MPALTGFRRPQGEAGIRNHVLILPVDDLSNAACTAVASIVRGTIAVSHPYGRLQFGADLDLFIRTLVGMGQNGNVAAVVVIGIEPTWVDRVVSGIALSQKPVCGFSIERSGDLRTVERAARAAKEYVQDATAIARQAIDWSDLIVSTKCGESDTTSGLASNPAVGRLTDLLVNRGARVIFGETSETTGGEHLIEALCATDEVRDKFRDTYAKYVGMIRGHGVDLLGSQPTEGNIRGGLTTIEEKGLGNVQKAGTSRIVDVLEPAQPPAQAAGLYFMDSSSAAAEMVTLCSAGGSIVHFFTTGQGNVVGHPLTPVIKTTANPQTADDMAEHIDVDISELLSGSISLDDARDMLVASLVATANGRLTSAEVLGHVEFAPTRLFPSA